MNFTRRTHVADHCHEAAILTNKQNICVHKLHAEGQTQVSMVSQTRQVRGVDRHEGRGRSESTSRTRHYESLPDALFSYVGAYVPLLPQLKDIVYLFIYLL